MSIAQRFKDIRVKLGFNQNEFANNLGTNQSGITDIERAIKKPSVEIMEILVNKYAINLNWLICGAGKMKLSESAMQVNEPQAEYGNNDVWKQLAEERKERIEELKKQVQTLEAKQLCTPFEIKQTEKKS